MTPRARVLLAAAFLGGGALGGLAGAYFGARFAFRLVLNEAIAKDARSVSALAAALTKLRGGSREKGLDAVESHLDDLLVLFDPVEPYPGLSARTQAVVEAAMREAAAYRKRHPRKGARGAGGATADEVLKRAK